MSMSYDYSWHLPFLSLSSSLFSLSSLSSFLLVFIRPNLHIRQCSLVRSYLVGNRAIQKAAPWKPTVTYREQHMKCFKDHENSVQAFKGGVIPFPESCGKDNWGPHYTGARKACLVPLELSSNQFFPPKRPTSSPSVGSWSPYLKLQKGPQCCEKFSLTVRGWEDI